MADHLADDLLHLALTAPDGESLLLEDRDDLDPEAIADARGQLTNLRNAADRANRALAQFWEDAYGTKSSYRTWDGRVLIHKTGSGRWYAQDPEMLAEYLAQPEQRAKLVAILSSAIPVSTFDTTERNTFLSYTPGPPGLTLTTVDNPKAPKWATETQPGTVITKGANR